MPLYFAYGSNMDEWQMRERCPRAKFKSVAKLEGWRLCFPRFSEKRNGGVASIEKAQNETVWGVVYEIPEEQWPQLDKSEGFNPKRPKAENAYQREEINVADKNGKTYKCRVYVANRDKEYRPSRECYLNYVIRGAEEHREKGMPAEYIEKLRSIRAKGE